MPFRFTCPHCGATTDVEDQFAGQAGACFSCGKAIQLPAEISTFTSLASQLIEQDRSQNRFRLLKTTLVVLVSMIVLGIAIWFLVNTVGSRIGLLGNSDSQASQSNLKKIALAMKSYHDDFGCYPPAFVADATGKPAHSWRVLLLPYLGEEHLYSQYNFNEAWNGPNNSQLESQMPSVFASPADEDAAMVFETSYMVIMGKNTAFPYARTVNRSQLTDGADNTILVAEIVTNGSSWMAPVDLDANNMTFEINSRDGVEIGSKSSQGASVVTADGKTYLLKQTTMPNLVESFSTINGNEPVRIESQAQR